MTNKLTSRLLQISSIGLILSTMMSCNALLEPSAPSAFAYNPTQPQRFERVADVTVSSSDSLESVSAQHQGTVISWHPEDGYATLGFAVGKGLSLQTTSTNLSAFKSPSADSASAAGLTSWSGGWSSWSGGWSAWSSGWSAWSGGNPSSAGGQNAQIWGRIKLQAAARLTPKAGLGITVAVIDTGIDLKHPMFKDSLTSASTWWDWVGGDASPQEEAGGSTYGHGTCVAGIVLQIAPKAKIMPLRVLGKNGFGDTANVIAAIEWAVNRGAKIINLSLGTTKDALLERALDYATGKGVLIVASSGNTGDENVTYPASASLSSGTRGALLVGVASTGLADRKSQFSTFSFLKTEMTAVGENVASAAPDNRIAVWNGTSMAAPMVSGGFALALAQRSFPDLPKVGEAMSKTYDSLLYADTTYFYQLGGRLNLESFLKTVLDPNFK